VIARAEALVAAARGDADAAALLDLRAEAQRLGQLDLLGGIEAALRAGASHIGKVAFS
jgi:hypothetical protein